MKKDQNKFRTFFFVSNLINKLNISYIVHKLLSNFSMILWLVQIPLSAWTIMFWNWNRKRSIRRKAIWTLTCVTFLCNLFPCCTIYTANPIVQLRNIHQDVLLKNPIWISTVYSQALDYFRKMLSNFYQLRILNSKVLNLDN